MASDEPSARERVAAARDSGRSALSRVRQHAPAERLSLVAVGLGLLFLLTPLFVQFPNWSFLLFDVATLFVLFAMLIAGLNLHYGHAGLVNFGHVVFFAVGGYAAAMLTAENPFAGVALGLPWPVGIAGSVVAAAALGGLLGVATLRLRDDFLAIVTLAVAEIVHDLLGTFQGITGGGVGLGSVPTPIDALAGSVSVRLFATLAIFGGIALALYAGVRRLTTAPYGRVLHAIRDDAEAAATLGKDVFRYKFVVFVYGAAIAGFAGALYAFYNGSVAPGLFTIDVTVTVWVGMLVGGAGRDRGVIYGLAIIMGFRLLTRFANDQVPGVGADQFASLRLIAVGILLVLVIRFRPQGIWGDPDRLGVDQ